METAAQDFALRWMDADSRGHIFLTSGCKVVWANSAARAELQNAVYLALEAGRVVPVSQTHRPAFERLAVNSDESGGRLYLPGPSKDHCMIVRLRRMLEHPDGPIVALDLRQGGESALSVYTGVDEAFGLTRSETLVLQNLTDGLTVEDVARRLKISVETARTHVRNMYRKVGVQSREGLFKKARPYLDVF